jgi:predicted esterase
VLLVQADDDRIVPFQQAVELIEGLRSHNVNHEVITIPTKTHDIPWNGGDDADGTYTPRPCYREVPSCRLRHER